MKRLTICILALILLTGTVNAARLILSLPQAHPIMVPKLDGRGYTTSGVPVPDDSYQLELSIWDAPTGGNMLWSESHTVVTKDGLFSADIGSDVEIPLSVIIPDSSDTLVYRYLQMEFDNEIISPRSQLGGQPYAHVALRMRGDIITRPNHMEMLNIDASSDSGITVEMDVNADSSGEIVGRLAFYESNGSSSRAANKPKEIVVVGSKITEKTSHFHNIQNNISDYEFVKGQASGKRTYNPVQISSAVLPDTIPGYSLTVDSNGTEMMMAKNNSDNSSCWIRVSQTSAGSIDSMVAATAASTTQKVDKTTPLLAKALCKNEAIGGEFVSVQQLVSNDSGYSHAVTLSDGNSTTESVDAADYVVWRKSLSTHNTSGDTAIAELSLSVDSGYSHTVTLTDGNSTTESVDAADYVIWRKTLGSHNTSGDTANTELSLSVDSGYSQTVTLTDGNSTTQKVDKSTPLLAKALCRNEAISGEYTNIEELVSADSGYRREITLDDGKGMSSRMDDTSSTLEMYQNVIDRSKVEKIVMKQTALAGSRLYVGNLGFNTSDGFHVNAELVGGTKVGINTGTPSAALDVNGSVEIGNGTPIVQVLSASASLDFPLTGGAGGTSDLSISMAGAAVGDVVSLGVPAGSVTSQAIFTGWVSAPSVVTVRFANLATASINPASGTFRAMVTKF